MVSSSSVSGLQTADPKCTLNPDTDNPGLSESGFGPETVHCGQLRQIDLGKRNMLIVEVSNLRVFGQLKVSGQVGNRS
jgi:hypothetical protein